MIEEFAKPGTGGIIEKNEKAFYSMHVIALKKYIKLKI